MITYVSQTDHIKEAFAGGGGLFAAPLAFALPCRAADICVRDKPDGPDFPGGGGASLGGCKVMGRVADPGFEFAPAMLIPPRPPPEVFNPENRSDALFEAGAGCEANKSRSPFRLENGMLLAGCALTVGRMGCC